jgi:hypothetical protein
VGVEAAAMRSPQAGGAGHGPGSSPASARPAADGAFMQGNQGCQLAGVKSWQPWQPWVACLRRAALWLPLDAKALARAATPARLRVRVSGSPIPLRKPNVALAAQARADRDLR